jgi:uncharacterized protein
MRWKDKKAAEFRFYADLNDFLVPAKRHRIFRYEFELKASVKDAIQSLGAPHTEIDLILINGQPVSFNRSLADGDHVSVFPRFCSIDIALVSTTRPGSPPRLAFALDVHLGRLATYLRLLGFDALYRYNAHDEYLASISRSDSRILLTRDRGLLCRNKVIHGYYVRSTSPREQAREVALRFDLASHIQPFTRCLRCNALLQPAELSQIADRVPSRSRESYSEFSLCTKCNQVFWKGSHYENMQCFIASIAHTAPCNY